MGEDGDMAFESLAWACLFLSAGAAPNDVWHMNTGKFQIPIRIQPNRRDEIKELQLFSSRDQGKTWDLAAKATPDKENFPYFAPGDGLYWFSVAVIDQKGQQDPRDIMKAPVGQKIVVDTLRPEVRILSAERQGEEILVRWEARDEYPDFPTLKVEYRTPESPSGLWTQAPATPGITGQVTFRPGSMGPVSVRVSVQDLAGNVGQAQAEVGGNGGSVPPVVSGPMMPSGPLTPLTPPAPKDVSNWNPNGTAPAPGSLQPSRGLDPLDAPPGPPLVPGMPVSNSSNRGVVALSGPPPMNPSGSDPLGPMNPGTRPPTGRLNMPDLKIVNKRQMKLDFEVAKFGPSGLGRVNVFVTTDDGQTWEKQITDGSTAFPMGVERSGGPVRGSVGINLMQEGVPYGFTVVVESKAGLSKAPPQRGDAPQIRLELDMTLPEAQLFQPAPDPGRRDTLLLTWKAQDRNLAANPISLEWAERKDGPWNYIGSPELPNTGKHSWPVPPNAPASVYLRLTVRDTAGNTAVAQTSDPVLVDLTVPEVSVISLGTNGR